MGIRNFVVIYGFVRVIVPFLAFRAFPKKMNKNKKPVDNHTFV